MVECVFPGQPREVLARRSSRVSLDAMQGVGNDFGTTSFEQGASSDVPSAADVYYVGFGFVNL